MSTCTYVHTSPPQAGRDSWSGETETSLPFSPGASGAQCFGCAGPWPGQEEEPGLLGGARSPPLCVHHRPGARSNPSVLVPVHIRALNACWPHYRKAAFSSRFWVSSAHPGLQAPRGLLHGSLQDVQANRNRGAQAQGSTCTRSLGTRMGGGRNRASHLMFSRSPSVQPGHELCTMLVPGQPIAMQGRCPLSTFGRRR